jgi:hypothetical protein
VTWNTKFVLKTEFIRFRMENLLFRSSAINLCRRGGHDGNVMDVIAPTCTISMRLPDCVSGWRSWDNTPWIYLWISSILESAMNSTVSTSRRYFLISWWCDDFVAAYIGVELSLSSQVLPSRDLWSVGSIPVRNCLVNLIINFGSDNLDHWDLMS